MGLPVNSSSNNNGYQDHRMFAVNEGQPAVQNTRPRVVTTIAILQFVKASILLIAVALILTGHKELIDAGSRLREVIIFASHGKQQRGSLFLVLGIYSAVVGWGLWRLKRWARNSLVLSCTITMLLWFAHQQFHTDVLTIPLMRAMQDPTLYSLLLADFVVFAYLKFERTCARAFSRIPDEK